MTKVILAYCVENQFAAAKIASALASKAEVEKVIFDADRGIKLLEKQAQKQACPVLLLISDNFLKSEKCMNEALALIQSLGNQKRLIPVTTEGVYAKDGKEGFTHIPTTFDRVSNVIQYMNYWQDRYLELRRAKPNGVDEMMFSEMVRIVRAISSEVGEMLRYLRGMEYFSFDQFEESNFIILYRVLGINISSSDLDNIKKIAVSHTVYPAESAVEKPALEAVHVGNGKTIHTMDTAIAEIHAPLDPEFDTIEKQEMGALNVEITPKINEKIDVSEHKQQTPITSDLDIFSKPENLEALIEDIKKDTGYVLEKEDKITTGVTNINQVIDDVIHEDDKKTDAILHATYEPKILENLDNIFKDDKKEDIETPVLNEIFETVAQKPLDEESVKHDISRIFMNADAQSNDDALEFDIKSLETETPTIPLDEALNETNDALDETIVADVPPISAEKDVHTEGVDALKLAEDALENQQYHEAVEHLEMAIVNDRTNVEAYMMMAFAAEQTGDYLLSLSCLEKVTLVKPEYPGIFHKLGMLINEHFSSQKRKAIRYFTDSIKHEPTNTEAYYQLAKLELEQGGDFEMIIAYLQEALKYNPNHAESAFELAKVHYEMGNKAQAAQLYERACAANTAFKTDINNSIFKYEMPVPQPELVVEPEPIVETLNDNGMVVLITGATSGIGYATAEIFAKNGYRLILTGRRSDRLETLKTQFEETYKNKNLLLNFDVRDAESVKNALSDLDKDFKNVDILINNAGLASGLSPIHEGDIMDWDLMIDTNIKGLLYMTRAVAPQMVARRKGHIINLCSIAGKEIYPNGNVYNATKHAVDALTRSMRVDLHKHNIRVSQVAPGAVEQTEFALVRFHGDPEKAKIYEDFTPLKASDVAETIYFIATRSEYVNIQDVVIMCTQQASANHLDRSGRTDNA